MKRLLLSLLWAMGLLAISPWQLSAADTLFYVSGAFGTISQVSSSGVVTRYATFSGSSDIPEGLALDGSGTLYIADSGQGLFWKIPHGGTLRSFANTGNMGTYGLVLGSSGNLYSTALGLQESQIKQITPAGVVSVFTQLPTGSECFGLVFDGSGNFFAADTQLGKVYKITPAGEVTKFVVFSTGTEPTGLVFDKDGNLFVSDFGGNIYSVTPEGAVKTFATLPSNAGLRGLAFDAKDNLYVAEQNRNIIGMITPDGVISDFANVGAPQFLLPVNVPEPTTLWLLGIAGLMFVIRLGARIRS